MAKKSKKRPSRPTFKLPDSFKDRSTKSGSKTIKGKSPKKTGVRGFRPGDTSKKAVFGIKPKKK